ncbi:bi-domain-containing oxidoreductase [Paraburkholderia ferrariae]|uniref:bi-domain-containing oxidoreductase n=1 Tax=Paraburkholderia ferrariae TaxID=386056 RepID=UPI00047FA6A3|nr:bi-domain-containing oxidoreductase [Paraburkholderia ferrariae]
MKQVLQNLKDGRTTLWDVPMPAMSRGSVLIETTTTLLSSGTERMLVDFGRASLLGKAMQQPDRVRDALQKVRTDGLVATLSAITDKLDQPLPLGYCNAGVVTAAGADVGGIRVGDRVVSNGKHAEYVTVGENLCVRIPDNVPDEDATFAIPAAIGLQGVRLAAPTLGETFVVIGLGLIGLLTVQILIANGCRVIGIDRDPSRAALAATFGATTVPADADVVMDIIARTGGIGVDGVLICASTSSDEPVAQAAKMSRPRGRIVLVGVAGLALSRADFYEKELSFQVSCSYGPGRYDPRYEEKGFDYPIGHVRWTENRNIAAALRLMADGRLTPQALITHRFKLDEAERAYALLVEKTPSLGIVIGYPQQAPERNDARLKSADASERTVPLTLAGKAVPVAPSAVRVNVIGAGNYAGRVLIPAFRRAGAALNGIASRNGVTAAHYGRKHAAAFASTDAAALCASPDAQAVVIATRHDTHAEYVLQALQQGKHVFVEKPLCLTRAQLERITEAMAAATRSARLAKRPEPILMAGFNRRFAPQVTRIKNLLAPLAAPKALVLTVNAGMIAPDHWTQDRDSGGGRIIGEACHFVDLLRYLAGSPIASFEATGFEAIKPASCDTASITLRFESGSVGTIHYFANGHRSLPKERLEVFCGGKALVLDNFLKLRCYGWPQFTRQNLWRQNKGQEACVAAFVDAIANSGPAPIPLAEVLEVSGVTIDIAQELG